MTVISFVPNAENVEICIIGTLGNSSALRNKKATLSIDGVAFLWAFLAVPFYLWGTAMTIYL